MIFINTTLEEVCNAYAQKEEINKFENKNTVQMDTVLYQCKIWPMNSRTILNRISSVYNRARKGLDAIFLINLNMNMSFIRCTTMALTLFSLIMQKLD